MEEYSGPKVFPTVDVALVDTTNLVVLLGRKASDPPGRYRFPGGFVDVNDIDYLDSAYRELREETSIDISKTNYLSFVGSTRVDDPRYLNSPNKLFTSLFIGYVDSTHFPKAQAGDDLEEIIWVPLNILQLRLVTHHRKLGSMLLHKLQTVGFTIHEL